MGPVLSNRRSAAEAPPAWASVLRRAVTDPVELCRRVGVDPRLASAEAARRFPVLVPETWLGRIRLGDPDDPILRQVLPTAAELRPAEGFSTDPLAEDSAESSPGVLQRYAGRSLIITTGRCGVHCRYCFRRHRLGPSAAEPDMVFLPAGEGTSLLPAGEMHEVILSGGDPLTLPDEQLDRLVRRLAEVKHLRRLRVHSRLPVAIPQRVTEELLRLLRPAGLTTFLVVQVNHAAELDTSAGAALGRLIDAGVPVMSQSVLLRGVNDSAAALGELFERLVDLRVLPYYLHQLDRVAGAAHFEVPEAEGRRLIGQVRDRLPGYAVPRYVRQTPRERSKRLLDGD